MASKDKPSEPVQLAEQASVSNSETLAPSDSQVDSSQNEERNGVARKSSRLQLKTFPNEIVEFICNKVSCFNEFVEECEANKVHDRDIAEFIDSMNKDIDAAKHMYDELCDLCNTNKVSVDETVTNMLHSFADDVKSIEASLQGMINEQQRKKDALAKEREDLRLEEEEIEAAEASLRLKVARYKQLRAKIGQRTRRDSTQHSPSPTNQQEERKQQREKEIDITNSGNKAINDLTDALINTMRSSRRRTPEPQMFDGDPMEFGEWEADFDAYIEFEHMGDREALRYLRKTLSGKAKATVAGNLMDDSAHAYQTARKQLRQRFGDQFGVGRALRVKLSAWPKIHNNKAEQLREFADLLLYLKGARKTNKELTCLDDSFENEKMVAKLPNYLIERWAEKIKGHRKVYGEYPPFEDFADFVDSAAQTACEPIMALRYKESTTKTGHNNKLEKTENHARVRSTATKGHICVFCNKGGKHDIDTCRVFKKLSRAEQETYVKENRLCWACLKTGHSSKECSNRLTCETCQRRHPTSMHRDNWTSRKPENKLEVAQEQRSTEVSTDTSTKSFQPSTKSKAEEVKVKSTTAQNSTTFNWVLPVYISSESDNKEILVYAEFDTQSDSSFIRSDIARQLKTSSESTTINVDTLNGEKETSVNRHLDLRIRGYKRKEVLPLTAYDWANLSCDRREIPDRVNVSRYPNLRHLADELSPPLDIPIALLIGRNCSEAFAPVEIVKGGPGKPFAIKSVLGWLIMGGGNKSKSATYHITKVKVNSCQALPLVLREDDDDMLISQEDLRFMSIMEQQTTTATDGSIFMPLPFKDSRPILPNNRKQAEGRLASLLRKFKGDQAFCEKYEAFMTELIDNGHAEEVSDIGSSGEVWYIPHFAVKHPKKDKLRIVFDCSATYSNTCLNDHLLTGPDMLNSLIGILCRFRKEEIALACDIEKMFYNFYVKDTDRDFLRFLWTDSNGTIREYRMTVHLFGAASSPGVATYGLRSLAANHQTEFPKAAMFIAQNFYVDDGVTSLSSVEEAKQLISDSVALCDKGRIRLHKFVSNSTEVISSVPESERLQTQQLFEAVQPSHRTLGMEWSTASDTLRYTTDLKLKPATRRGILSTVAQLYDPLGLLAPYILQGKNVLQEVNNAGLYWDDPIPKRLEVKWQNWTSELNSLSQIVIPRCIKPKNFGKVTRTELHHFSDASFDGIGACSYIRQVNEQNQVNCSLVMAKSRVIPSKGKITIPRLELQAAVLATTLGTILNKELDLDVDANHYWSDSKIVLAYIANDAKRFHIYVANRINTIRQQTKACQWHHVPGEQNPADLASRGLECHKLNNSMWFNGPSFLQTFEPHSRDVETTIEVDQNDPEIRAVARTHTTEVTRKNPIVQLTEHYSEFSKLTRAVAHLQRIVRKKAWKTNSELGAFEADDLSKARNQIILSTQKHYLPNEFHAQGKDSSVRQLRPFVDEKGLLCVGGRANKSSVLTQSEINPVIIPKGCPLAQLIVREVHQKKHHLGRSYTLSAVRQAGFWIIAASQLIKRVINSCVICRRLRDQPQKQLMGELPAERVGKAPPFQHSGMDVFGPFIVKERRTELKRYALLFTCMYSRAVHIEVLDDLSTDCFLNALRCFTCIRGNISTLHSDNGTNFVGANNILRQLSQKILHSKHTKNTLAEQQIQFVMTTPNASHQGGVWERQIRTARSILGEILYNYKARLDTSMLRTFLYETAATMNSRPISLVDIKNPESVPLTPNSLLTGNMEIIPPPPGDHEEGHYVRQRWRQVQALAEEFWRKWKVSYYDQILKTQKWNHTKENLKPDDLVLVVDDDATRNDWKLGRIEEVYPGKDELVRKAKVRIGSRFLDGSGKPMDKVTYLHRPIQKLVKLLAQ